ncbi:Carbonyl reductase [NADPH] 1 [Daldinia childiae]|uniref:Carbonyl reductase [NADPH] 1 n=1 Tax=Daldinia childiae TaxID=326645 RepID=UPI001444E820|nr:Carbonyl reductase [NADPH] 1 [Daldinia childiae]KAF3070623.1 Carbonyl reductase [NADPH] 1 [Daldinia childiae]
MSGMLYQAYMKWHPIPLPPSDSFKDQAILVTGGTSGLGLAAAVHFVNLGASEVIITSRSASRAKAALETIEKETKGRSRDRVRVLDLDMSHYASVVAFAQEAKKIRAGKGGIDFAVLNAGILNMEFSLGDEGSEQNVKTNALSTALLGFLLLQWMKTERPNRSAPAHLAAVGSSQHLAPNTNDWTKWASETGILEHFNKPENWPGSSPMYGATKLLAQYAVNELVEMSLGPDGRPEVIINTMCPGIVRSDLPRQFMNQSVGYRIFIAIYFSIFSKTAENGARTYVATGLTKENEHVSDISLPLRLYYLPTYKLVRTADIVGFNVQGKFIRFYGSEAEYRKKAEILLTGEAGRKMQAQVWSEMKADFIAKIPNAKEVLGL